MTDFLLLSARAVRLPDRVAGDAVMVGADSVAAIGKRAELREQLPDGATCREEHFDGYIVPGLHDSHIHPVAYTALLTGAPLHQAANLTDIQQMLREAAQQRPGLVTGSNLDEQKLAERRLPTASELDAVIPDRPVIVHRYDGHLAIVNTAALRTAGITARTSNPPGGVIDRDDTGEPTGVLRETAIDLVATAPGIESPVSPDDVATAMRRLAGLGITSIGAMLRTGAGPWAHLGDEVEIVTQAAPGIPIRLHGFVAAETFGQLDTAAERLENAGETMDWAGVKRFGDGSFGSHTAAMFEAFTDLPGQTGVLRLNDHDVAMAHAAVAAGRAVAIHAIGDAAAARVLDVFDHLVREGVEPYRLRMEHASVLANADIDRMGKLGVVASVQPAFLGSEAGWIEQRLGRDRLLRTYAFASLIEAGALVVGGSDSPVESPDPWEAMALCQDRAGVVPAEKLSPQQALDLYTTAAARALGEPEPLANGSPADLIVVDRDPVTCSPDELRQTEVLATFVGGQRVQAASGRWWID